MWAHQLRFDISKLSVLAEPGCGHGTKDKAQILEEQENCELLVSEKFKRKGSEKNPITLCACTIWIGKIYIAMKSNSLKIVRNRFMEEKQLFLIGENL